jgi:integrase
MRKKLTAPFVAAARCEPGSERSIYWDTALPSFGLQVTQSGARSYVCQYRCNGRSHRTSISGLLSLSDARKEAASILGRVAKGGNPLVEQRKAKAAAEDTLQSICTSYFAREGKKLRTTGDRQAALERLVYPRLGSRQINDISRSDLTRLLDKIEDERGPVMADRTLAYLSRVFNWHAGRSDDFRSPIVRGMRRTKASERARERILDDDEIKSLWTASASMQNAFGPLCRFILLTGARRNEAAKMRRAELDGDVWTIPGSRYKNKRDHVVPLSKAARDIIDALPVIDGGTYIFSHDGRRPIGGFDHFKKRLDEASGVTGWTLHDLRRTARSLMSRAGISADIGERCLGHSIGGVRGVYDRHAYLDEKRRAFEALAALIERVVDPQANVVPLRA